MQQMQQADVNLAQDETVTPTENQDKAKIQLEEEIGKSQYPTYSTREVGLDDLLKDTDDKKQIH